MSKRANQDPQSLVEKQQRERRRRILASARRFVIKHGVDGVNVRALAEACRISVPTIYRTFGSKEGLISEAMQPYLEAAVRVEEVGEVRGEGYERLLGLIELWSQGFAGAGDDESAFMSELLKSETGQALAFKVSRRIRVEAQGVLREMRDRGELEPWADPLALASRLAAQTVVSAIESASGALSPDGYRSAFVYASCLLIAGASTGVARTALCQRAERAQASALSRAQLARAQHKQA